MSSLVQTWASFDALLSKVQPALDPRIGKVFDPWVLVEQPEDDIRDYFGEKIALYFAFIRAYTEALLWLAFFGILNSFTLSVIIEADSELSLAFSAGYSILVLLWTVIFMESVERKQAELRFLWGTELFEEQEKPRKQFAASTEVVWRTDPYDGKLAPFRKNKWHKVLKIVATSIVQVACMAGAVGLVILSHLAKQMTGTFGEDWAGHIGTLFNVVAILCSGAVFNEMADSLTAWENHRTQTMHEDSRIYKTFLFDAVNNYFTLIFTLLLKEGMVINDTELHCLLVTVDCPDDGSAGGDPNCAAGAETTTEPSCMAELRLELFLYFMVGQFFQTAYTTYMGTFQVMNTVEKASRLIVHKHSQSDKGMTYAEHAAHHANAQASKGTYAGVFMDYSELAVQFGYASLFASCFPLAPVMCCFGNVLEVRADAYKLCRRYRRPEFLSAEDIGAWQVVLQWVATAAILTNAVLIVFTAADMGKMEDDLEAAEAAAENHEQQVERRILDYRLWIIVVIIEHAVFMFRYMTAAARPEEPEWISQTKAHLAQRMSDRLRTDDDIARRQNALIQFQHVSLGWTAAYIAKKVKAKHASQAGTQLCPHNRRNLVKLFYDLDVNASGTLSPDELLEIHEAGVLPVDCMSYDTDENGLISVVEWLDGWQNRPHTVAEMAEIIVEANDVIENHPLKKDQPALRWRPSRLRLVAAEEAVLASVRAGGGK